MKLWKIGSLLALSAIPLVYAITGTRAFESKQAYWLEDDPDYAYYISSVNLACGRRPGFNDHPGMGLKYVIAAVVRAAHPLASDNELRLSALKHSEMFMRITNILLIALFALLTWFTAVLVLRATHDLALAILSQIGPLYYFHHFLYFSQKIAAELVLLICAQGLSLVCVTMLADDERQRHGARYALLSALICAYAVSTKVNFAPLLIIPFFVLPCLRWKALYIVAILALASAFLVPVSLQDLRHLFLRSLSGGVHAGGPITLLPPNLLPTLKRFVDTEAIFFVVLAVSAMCGIAGVISAVVTKREGPLPNSMMLLAVCLGTSLQILAVAKNVYNYYMIPAFGMCGLLLTLSGIVLKEVTSGTRVLQVTLVNGFVLLVLAGGMRGVRRAMDAALPSRVTCYNSLTELHREIFANQNWDAIVMRGGFFNTSHPTALMAGDIHQQPVMQNAQVIRALYPRVFSYAWWLDRPDRCLRGGEWWTLGAVLTWHTNVLFVTVTNQLCELSMSQLESTAVVCGNYGIYRVKPFYVNAVSGAHAEDADSNMRLDYSLFGTRKRPVLAAMNVTGAYARFALSVSDAGAYDVFIRYASRTGHVMDLVVNRVAYRGVKVPATGGNSVTHSTLVMIPRIALHAGTNMLLLRGRGSLPQIENVFVAR